ncbi:PREDICTED: uncharacterized protein LOC104603457 [Nelumbo nucifera]|uniref:Uncharacterized protein n=2 Tax=Nelumbo nucifera TaxID=4432 RepID=A0A822YFW2_NELNU|nr:PREDICTED: uncharacterized protein LOC104603457 [Nelumbo nucifera]DAD29876.1 TPA_asm: hypothetical protein HUJ06_031344 [Nelumbo nucifera]
MEGGQELEFHALRPSPSLVSLVPFSPSITSSPRRLSTHFSEPSRPIRAARQLCWVSLQGRLVGAEEASSVKAIGGKLSGEEGLAWELFKPIHRILIVAIVAIAVADLNFKKSRQIWQLRRSVDLRDQVLSSMQKKLDDLCEQLSSMKEKEHPEIGFDMFTNSKDFLFSEDINLGQTGCSACGCRVCNQNRISENDSVRNSIGKACSRDEKFKLKVPFTNGAEQEERRMSDLSDWAPSVSSSAEIQLNTLAVEQDIYNLQRECEEKDATIRELEAVVRSSDVAGSKRIAELEDVIRRKNMIITKLKKDMAVLEQQVAQLTRIQRPSTFTTKPDVKKLPVMSDNILYGMDSSTSPSSSDSDSPVENRSRGPVHEHRNNHALQEGVTLESVQKVSSAKTPNSSPRPIDKPSKIRDVSPLKENSMNQRLNSMATTRPRQLASGGGDVKRNRRHGRTSAKDMTPQKRWI